MLEPVQGEGGFVDMPADFPGRLAELCREHGVLYVDDEVQSGIGRTGPVWAIEHYETEPDLLVSGKSLGGGLPLAAVTGRAEVMDAPHPGGLGGTFGGNPVACAAALAVLDEVSTDEFRTHALELAATIRTHLDGLASRVPQVGDVRGIGAMLALELVTDRESKEPAADLAKRTTEAARERGLILLSCGTLGNVIRILVPLVISDDDLARGLEILEESLVDAAAHRLTYGSKAVRKAYGDVVAVDGIDLEVPAGRVLHHARPVRLRQDDDAAPDRRLRVARRGPHPPRRAPTSPPSRPTSET